MNQISTVLNELEDDVLNHPVDFGSSVSSGARRTAITESKAYIQQKGTFLESTPDKLTDTTLGRDQYLSTSKWDSLPGHLVERNTIDVAILFQSKSHILSNLCYGFLGGISLMQLVLTHTLVKGSKHEIMSFIELYSKFGFVPSASFTILTTTCLVFALDRIDLITMKKHFKNGDRTIFSNWLILILYLSMFILSVLCFKFDEVIATYPQSKNAISTYEDLWTWKTLNLWKCIFGITGWFVICITRPQDALKLQLCSLRKMKLDKNQNTTSQ